MGWPKKILFGWKALFGSHNADHELEEELRFHVEMETRHNVEKGMPAEEARAAAVRSFGGSLRHKESCRDAWGLRTITDTFRDIRYAARSLLKSKGFSFAVVATLALCIGANTTIFSVLYGLILKPLPFENPDRIVRIYNIYKSEIRETGGGGWSQYLDFNAQADLFEGFVLAKLGTKIRDGAEVDFRGVTSDFFEFLGVRPLLGRFFTPEEVHPGPGNVIVLTQTSWENDYGADPNVIGKEIKFLLGSPYTIVGVAPRRMEALYANVKFFAPLVVRGVFLRPQNRRMPGTDMWARLKPGVSRAQAYSQLVLVETRAWEEYKPAWIEYFKNIPRHFAIDPPHPLKSSLTLLQGGTLFLLIVGCMNIVNLLLLRSARRCPEMAVRHSFGAGRLVLGRMMLAESLLLTTGGLLVGSLLARGGVEAINRYLVVLFPMGQPVGLSGAVMFWTLFSSLVLAVILGLLPVALLWKSGQIQKVGQSSRRFSAGRKTRFLTGSLVVSQIAIAFALLIGAGLLIRSFRNVLDVKPGFDAAHVASGHVNIQSVYPDKQDWVGVRKRILDKMRTIPGVEHVSFDGNPVIVGLTNLIIDWFAIKGGASESEPDSFALIKFVGGEYFATMGINILDGRAFHAGVDASTAECIIDQSFANRYLKDRVAVGASVRRSGPVWKNVVGVAARVNYQGLENRDGSPVVYMCFDQIPWRHFTILVRSTRSSESVIREMQAKLHEVDPRLHLQNPTSLASPLGTLQMDRKGLTVMAGIFAGLALMLSAIGIYGVLSYDVQQRRREIGIRAAIGATSREILEMILAQGLWKAGLGLILGLMGALVLSRYLSSRLFDVSALDPATYVAVSLGLLLVALTACFIPARRATRIDPVIALRAE